MVASGPPYYISIPGTTVGAILDPKEWVKPESVVGAVLGRATARSLNASSKNSGVRQERRARPCRAPGTSSKAPWGRVQNPLVPPLHITSELVSNSKCSKRKRARYIPTIFFQCHSGNKKRMNIRPTKMLDVAEQ